MDLVEIVDKHRISVMNATLKSLQNVLDGWLQSGSIPEAGWGKHKVLEFQELLQRREALVRRLATLAACTSCPAFEEHVSRNLFPSSMCATHIRLWHSTC